MKPSGLLSLMKNFKITSAKAFKMVSIINEIYAIMPSLCPACRNYISLRLKDYDSENSDQKTHIDYNRLCESCKDKIKPKLDKIHKVLSK